MKKFIFLELFLRIIEDEKWNLFVKLGQLRTPNPRLLEFLNFDIDAYDQSANEYCTCPLKES